MNVVFSMQEYPETGWKLERTLNLVTYGFLFQSLHLTVSESDYRELSVEL